jgi:hypothetical protein
VHVKKLTWGNHRTTALSLVRKGRVVAEKRAIRSTMKVPFPPWLLNTQYFFSACNEFRFSKQPALIVIYVQFSYAHLVSLWLKWQPIFTFLFVANHHSKPLSLMCEFWISSIVLFFCCLLWCLWRGRVLYWWKDYI